ncbi:serine/threonine protein kinase, AGC [Marasmius tenuissimus]|nr:serine/threonine protein kinase, AGC [Marasmius tenuissimus]
MNQDRREVQPDTDQLKYMSGRRRTTSSLWGNSSLMAVLNTLKEAMEISAVESWLGKISKLAMEIMDAAQVADTRTESSGQSAQDQGQADQPNIFIFTSVIIFRTLLHTPTPNEEAFRKLIHETCLLASSLSTRCKALKTKNDPAKLSPTLTAHLKALQITFQEIKVFAQRRADRAIWKLYLSAQSDLDSIQGFRGRLREALDVLARTQSSIASLDIKRADIQIRRQDGLRTDPDAALVTDPHLTPIRTRGPGLPTPTSSLSNSSKLQSLRTTDTDTSDPLRIETPDGLRRKLSTISGLNALLALEKGPVVARTVDLLQLEILSARPDPNRSEYLKKCATCLEALVNKHHTLPASLFVNDVVREGMQPCNGGGFSDVWKGSHGTQAVCLKVLRVHAQGRHRKRDRLVKAFHKEALLWTRLSHPNLLPFIGVNTTLFPQGFCLVSPWMANGDIIGFLELTPGHDRLASILDISAGMAHLHECEIVHGDIKGANVLVNEAGRALLADFGLAITVADSTTRAKPSTSEMKGSIRWMAPELFRSSNGIRATMGGGKDRTHKFSRDVYAFACTVLEVRPLSYSHACLAYELVEQVITGKPPFAELTDPTVMYEVMVNNARPSRPSPGNYWCPDNVWTLVERCWAQRPQDRPTASEVHEFLSKLVNLRNSGAHWEDVSL